MKHWRKLFLLVVSLSSLTARAEYGDSWSFDLDIGGYGYDSFGGGCGSYYGSCYSAYDTSGLYGSNWGSLSSLYGGYTVDIDISLLTGGGFGYGSYGDIGCSIGYCSTGTSLPYTMPTYNYTDTIFGSNPYQFPIQPTPMIPPPMFPPPPAPPIVGPPYYPPIPPPVYVPPTVPPVITPGTPPTVPPVNHTPTDQFVPRDPVRYKVPRGSW